jgi:CBS domain-containing protein
MLREVVDARKDPLKTLAKDTSYTPLIILEGDESMIDAMKIMGEKGFKRAAMVKNGQLIGMLTEETAKKATLKNKPAATKVP